MHIVIGLNEDNREWQSVAAYKHEEIADAVYHLLGKQFPHGTFDVIKLGDDTEVMPPRTTVQVWLGTVIEATRDHSRSRL